MNLTPDSDLLQPNLLQKVVQETELPPEIKIVAICRGDELHVWRSQMAEDDGKALAQELVQRVHETWENREGVAELRFLTLQRGDDGLLLYTESLPEPYALVMAAAPQISVNTLRTTARTLVKTVEQQKRAASSGNEDVVVLIDQPFPESVSLESTFAIAWRPRKPVPRALLGPLTRAVKRLAGANGCQIAHFSLHPRVIQLVVACPPGKNSAWIAHTFKQGSQREIQRQFNIPATLWADGYFARESVDPLEPAEVQLFLT